MSSTTSPTLTASLVKSLSTLQSTRKLTVHVLKTEGRKTSSLYAHAVHPPKGVHLHDLMVMLYIHLEPQDLYKSPNPPSGSTSAPAESLKGGIDVPATTPTPDGASSSTSPSTQATHPVLLVALEAQLYTLPSQTSSPSSSPSTILYLSKVDTSGYPLPSSLSLPYARTLLTSFLSFHLSLPPSQSVWIHLFARAQPQYLFPDSGKDRQEEFGEPGKRVVGGAGLCRWWKGVLEDAQRKVGKGVEGEGEGERRVWVPGMSVEEAKPVLKTKAKEEMVWGHDLRKLPSPLAEDPEALPMSLRIPTFPDDPRSRFLTDLTAQTTAAPPSTTSSKTAEGVKEVARQADARARQHAEATLEGLGGGEEEFWERLAFRQECSLGDTVAFFCVANVRPPIDASSAVVAPAEDPTSTSQGTSGSGPTPTSPLAAEPGLVTKTLWARLHATLLNQAFSSAQRIVDGSLVVWEAVRSMTPEELMGEVEASVDGVARAEGAGPVKRVREEEEEVKAPVVQVLGVRKKVKKVAA